MIKAEKTIIEGRINLVDTEYRCGMDDKYFIKQISREEAIALAKSLLNLLK